MSNPSFFLEKIGKGMLSDTYSLTQPSTKSFQQQCNPPRTLKGLQSSKEEASAAAAAILDLQMRLLSRTAAAAASGSAHLISPHSRTQFAKISLFRAPFAA